MFVSWNDLEGSQDTMKSLVLDIQEPSKELSLVSSLVKCSCVHNLENKYYFFFFFTFLVSYS